MSYDAASKTIEYKGDFSANSEGPENVTVEIMDVDGNSVELTATEIDPEWIRFSVT